MRRLRAASLMVGVSTMALWATSAPAGARGEAAAKPGGDASTPARADALAAARPAAPAIVAFEVTPRALPSTGGRVTVTARLANARSCRLKLLSNPSPRVVFSGRPRPCQSRFSAHLIIAGNPSTVRRAIRFALVARNRASSATRPFSVTLSAPPAPAPTTPKTTTTLPTTTTAASTGPVAQDDSGNWSGYAVKGGPFTSVTGTFTVPFIGGADGCQAFVSEWVGIDGFNPTSQVTDTSLIQAGVEESDVDPSTGDCTPGQAHIWPWLEVLPAPEQLPASWSGAAVTAGDRVTVGVHQISAGEWAISLTDDTGGGRFSQDSAFDGPGATAEWVLEAGGNPNACPTGNGGAVCPLAPYTDAQGAQPGESFSGAAVSGEVTSWYGVTMVQSGKAVSTPSSLGTGPGGVASFSLTYTGSPEPP